MKYYGINYDTGTRTLTGRLTRERFDPDLVANEITIIKNELHCNAIRITGQEIDRVEIAAAIALEMDLTVLFSSSLQYETIPNNLQHIIQCAKAAERLRLKYPNVILVTAFELTLFAKGFIKGDTGEERIKRMFGPVSMIKNIIGIRRAYNKRLNDFLAEAVAAARKEFHGEITYASGTWEKVNWSVFDIIGIDFYRASYNAKTYRRELQSWLSKGKPVSIMEFGCCAYRGGEHKGAMGWAIVDWSKSKPELKGNYERDEDVQANYLLELLDIFTDENVFAAFVFTFISNNYTYNDDPKYDLDMAAYGIVRVMPEKSARSYKNMPWVPKKAFYELAKYFSKLKTSRSAAGK